VALKEEVVLKEGNVVKEELTVEMDVLDRRQHLVIMMKIIVLSC
jgi:hypothetical protein